MKIVICCPIRLADKSQNQEALDYIARLKSEGHEVFSYWDTLMEACPTGADILNRHLEAVQNADEVHVFWTNNSTGTHFEIGTAVAMNKKIVIVRCYDPVLPGQSYLKALCTRPNVVWRESSIPRPADIE